MPLPACASLYDDGSERPEEVTRDYHLDFDKSFGNAPLLTVYGGKITTYRRLAEAALAISRQCVHTALDPGPRALRCRAAIFPITASTRWWRRRASDWPFLNEAHALRLVRAYGTRIDGILGQAKSYADLGIRFGADLTAAEVRYLMDKEWAVDADDVLWRRSKLGLRFSRGRTRACCSAS